MEQRDPEVGAVVTAQPEMATLPQAVQNRQITGENAL
jgi:hypothetical protein